MWFTNFWLLTIVNDLYWYKRRQRDIKQISQLIKSDSDKTDKEDKKNIRKGFNFAVDAHKEMRKSGEPYIYHPLRLCIQKKLTCFTSIICLYYMTWLKTPIMKLKILKDIWFQSIKIIEGLTKISMFLIKTSHYSENFRKCFYTIWWCKWLIKIR